MKQHKTAKVRRLSKRPSSRREKEHLKILIAIGMICNMFKAEIEEFYI